MSFTLRGRIETRLAAALLPFLAVCAVGIGFREWWPLQLAGLMLGTGLALDLAYHWLLPYQPAWLAPPLGAVELAATMALVRLFDVQAPLGVALAFFALTWLLSQVLVHAVLPLAHLTYGDDGGELGGRGVVLNAAAPCALALVLGVAWVTRPPTVRLAAGVHQGPLVLDRAQTLVGEPSTIVRGGIVIEADDVTVRGLAVEGGEIGISVDGAQDVVLDRVDVSGATLDGINVRRSTVTIRDCAIHSLPGAYTQGIDISFGGDLAPSLVEGCTVTGGREGIVTHFSHVQVKGNRVSGTELRGITMTEMSMGSVERNEVRDALGVGIFCGDYSECEIERNTVSGTRPDRASADLSRGGLDVVSHYGARATLEDNDLDRAVGAYAGGRIVRH